MILLTPHHTLHHILYRSLRTIRVDSELTNSFEMLESVVYTFGMGWFALDGCLAEAVEFRVADGGSFGAFFEEEEEGLAWCVGFVVYAIG